MQQTEYLTKLQKLSVFYVTAVTERLQKKNHKDKFNQVY